MSNNVFLVYGEEHFLKDQYISDLNLKTIGAEDAFMNSVKIEGEKATPSFIAEVCETLPMFAEKRFVLVRDSGLFATGKKEATAMLEKWLPSCPSSTVLVFDESTVDKRVGLLKKMDKEYVSKEFKHLKPIEIERLVLKKVEEQNKTFAPNALEYFISSVSSDLTKIFMELEKLMAYEDRITKKAIDELCTFSIEQKVFELSKAVAKGDGEFALRFYEELISTKESSPFAILALLGLQYRNILSIKFLLSKNESTKEITSKTGLYYGAIKDLSSLAKKYSYKQLEAILTLCLEADQDIKRGVMPPEKCIEVLILNCLGLS